MAASPVGMKRFYGLLAAVAVVGIGLLGYQLSKPATVSIPANVQIGVKDTAGFHGYVKGAANAPVEITEYADYQCPFCQTFATLQMPTIEERLIKTGRLRELVPEQADAHDGDGRQQSIEPLHSDGRCRHGSSSSGSSG